MAESNFENVTWTTELAGIIGTNISNFCPDDNAEGNVDFAISQEDYCVRYEGLAEGEGSVCIASASARS